MGEAAEAHEIHSGFGRSRGGGQSQATGGFKVGLATLSAHFHGLPHVVVAHVIQQDVVYTLEIQECFYVEAFLNLKGVDYILLDNMSNDDMRKAVEMRGQGCKPYFEASGGLTLTTAPAAAETGVDFMSFGCLTHSVPSLDLGLDFTVER